MLLVNLVAGGEIVRVHVKLYKAQKAFIELRDAATQVVGQCLQKIEELWNENQILKEREARRNKIV